MIDRLLREIDKLLAAHAQAALSTPAERSAFEYGRVCGFHQGLVTARNKLLDTQKDAEEEDRDL